MSFPPPLHHLWQPKLAPCLSTTWIPEPTCLSMKPVLIDHTPRLLRHRRGRQDLPRPEVQEDSYSRRKHTSNQVWGKDIGSFDLKKDHPSGPASTTLVATFQRIPSARISPSHLEGSSVRKQALTALCSFCDPSTLVAASSPGSTTSSPIINSHGDIMPYELFLTSPLPTLRCRDATKLD